VVHPQIAMTPALAACAAGEQGKLFEMKEAIFSSAWEIDPQPRMKDPNLLNQENMEKLASSLGLKMDKFKADMAGDKCKNAIQNDQKQVSAVGTRGTPAFYINGRFISGAQPIDRFKAVIDEELKKYDAAVKAGQKADTYYNDVVVGKGKKSVQ
jgi:predicted DsbA family dithiol-disulfide isomerase